MDLGVSLKPRHAANAIPGADTTARGSRNADMAYVFLRHLVTISSGRVSRPANTRFSDRGNDVLTHPQLVTLFRALRDERVLSVYIDGSTTDPAMPRPWRVPLDHALKDLRTWLVDSSHDERESFERCVRLLEQRLGEFSASVGAPGWVAFIVGGDESCVAHQLPVPVPTLAVWSTGLCLAPYMRALKETRPVIIAVADARKAELYRYSLGQLNHVETVRAHHAVESPSHMGASPRQGFHTGTRGETGHDAAQRALLEGRDRMLVQAAHRIAELAGEDGWILLGGTRRVGARLSRHLAPIAPHRVLALMTFDVHSSEAEITEAARAGASTLRDAFDANRLADIVELSGAARLGVVGAVETRRALDQRSIRDLYVTRHYLDEQAAEAEDAVRSALDQDASVEEVSGSAAEQLDRLGGVAAGLRFRPATLDAAVGL